MEQEITVRYILGDQIDTDLITPGKYLTSYEDGFLGSICLKDAYPDFRDAMKAGGILIAGENFGCGSSRETAPIALKAAGVKLILAEEFARIFFRNAINIGLPCMECKGISKKVPCGARLTVDFSEGIVKEPNSGMTWTSAPLPEELNALFQAGGLMKFLKSQISHSQQAEEQNG